MSYPGGKAGSGVYQKIINQFPPHKVYIEAFLGGGAILRFKKPAHRNFGIEIDSKVILDLWTSDLLPYENIEIIRADTLTIFNNSGWIWDFANRHDTLIYFDPPYVLSTRKSHYPLYRFEMKDRDHAKLLSIITNLDCMVAISGYHSSLYDQYLENWRQINYSAMTRGGTNRIETLWMNYPEPLKLHDYSFLGSNYRERERIKKKANRWVNKLMHLPTLERHAIFHALDEEIQRRLGD